MKSFIIGAPHAKLWRLSGDATTVQETRRLIEQRSGLSRPGTLRRRYVHYTQRTVFAPSRPNKRSREEIAVIDAEIMRRANRLDGGYQPIAEGEEAEEEEEEEPKKIRE